MLADEVSSGGNLIAGSDISASVINNVGAVDITGDNISVVAFGAINNATIDANGNATADADGNASVTGVEGVSGSVDANGSVSVLSSANIDSTITAVLDASVNSIKGSLNGTVTTTEGDVTVLVGQNLTAAVTAGDDLTATVVGDTSASVSASDFVFGTFFGALQSTVTAGGSLQILAFEDVGGTISAGNNAIVTTLGSVNQTVDARGVANVTALGGIETDISGDRGVLSFAIGSHNGTVMSISGGVSVTTQESFDGTIDAESGVGLTALASADAEIVSGGAVSILTAVDANITSESNSLSLTAGGTLTGEITTDEDALISVLGSVNGVSATVGGSLNLLAGDEITGATFDAGGGNIGSDRISDTGVTSVGSINVLAIDEILSSSIDSDEGSVTAGARNSVTNLEFSSAIDASVFSSGVLSSLDGSAGGDLLVLGEDSVNATVNASGDATVVALNGLLSAQVTTQGSANVVGQTVNSSILADQNIRITSGESAFGDFAAGGNAQVSSGSDVTISSGSAIGDLEIQTSGSIFTFGTVTAENVSLFAQSDIYGAFAASEDIVQVATLGSLNANLTANDDVRRVLVFNDLSGGIFAVDRIESVTIGGEIQSSAVLDAASIGNVTENDRSDFVELPRSPTFNIGSLASLSADFRSQLRDLENQILEAEIGLDQQFNARSAQGRITETLTRAAAERAQIAAEALLTNLETGLELTDQESNARFQRAIENARESLSAGEFQAQLTATLASASFDETIEVLRASSEFRTQAANDAVEFTRAEAETQLQRQREKAENREAEIAILTEAYSYTFTAVFLNEVARFFLDQIQEQISRVAFVADFIPGLGTAVSVALEASNAAIDAARGQYTKAAFRAAFSIVPFAGGRILRAASGPIGNIGRLVGGR